MNKTVYAFDGLDEMEKALVQAIEVDFPAEFERLVLQIAWELQGKVKDLTPAKTGHLRREWHVGEIIKKGNEYYIEVYNNVEYAEAVEHGHRQEAGRFVPAIGKRLKAGFVPGKHMMEISLAEVETVLPAFLRERLDNFLKAHDL